VPLRALHRALRQDTLATSPELQFEIFRVLTQRFGWPEIHASSQLEALHIRAITVQLTHTIHVCRDPKDNMFLECAAIAKADAIVAGDKDLLVLGSYAGARILTPLEYLQSENV